MLEKGFEMKWFIIALMMFVTGTAIAGEGVVEVEVLKFYQTSKSHSGVDVRITNLSEKDVYCIVIDIEAYGEGDEYLGKADVMVCEMSAGRTAVADGTFLNVQRSNIVAYRVYLGGVVTHEFKRIDGEFKLRVK